LIEQAYTRGESLGLTVWCHDQGGPYQTVPHPGASWEPQGDPARHPAEYVRNGTAKVLTLFHPATGQVRVKGVTSCTNAVLHPWLQQELAIVLANLPEAAPVVDSDVNHRVWQRWQGGLTVRFTLPKELPPLRMLLILDNLTGHKTPDFVLWLVTHGIMPLYTPLGGSWLNMSESMQRILARRALAGQQPQTPNDIMQWIQAVARHWNQAPTPFEWAGKRAARRVRTRQRRYALGGSGACTRRPVRRTRLEKWLQA
jgi:hypothetical protein